MGTPIDDAWAALLVAKEKLKAAEYAAEIQGVELARAELQAAQSAYDTAKAAEEPPPPPPKPAPKPVVKPPPPAPPKPAPAPKPLAATPKPKPAPKPTVRKRSPKKSESKADAVTKDLSPAKPKTLPADELDKKAAKARAAADKKADKKSMQPGTYWNGLRYVAPTDKAWNIDDYKKATSKAKLEEKPKRSRRRSSKKRKDD